MNNWNHCKSMVRRRNPSFSSSLLDEICRSIDHQTPTAAAAAEYHHKTGQKTDGNMDMLLYNQPLGRKKSASAEYYFPQSFGLNSCSTSSDSSFWTSSDSDTSKSLTQPQLPVRKSFSSQQQQKEDQVDKNIYVSQRKLKNECGGFVKAKSKTLKLYNDLKKTKSKQPVSPGSRLATFLNSLFTSPTNAKKSKNNETKNRSSSACSSASSLSRSCLSKTPSSQGKLSDGAKRSVRFYPVVSVIMDEDKDNQRRRWNNSNTEKSVAMCGEEVRDRNWHARELLNQYQEKFKKCTMMDDDEEDEEEDCDSCVSSDLFELDNLDTVIGSSQRYCEELPVYETTSVDANRAIAHGFIL